MMFVQLSIADENNRILDPIAVEVKNFSIYGFNAATISQDGMFIDITHMDGEKERMTLRGDSRPFAPMYLNGFKTHGVTVVEYPSGPILSKAEWRQRVPAERILNQRGHFEEVK